LYLFSFFDKQETIRGVFVKTKRESGVLDGGLLKGFSGGGIPC
jgi:hypothetical protein